MKAFRFQYESALRWRNAQLSLQDARVSAAAAAQTRLHGQLQAIEDALRRSQEEIRAHPTGESLGAHAAFSRLAARHMAGLQKNLEAAARQLAIELNLRMEARRRAQLLENLKSGHQAHWQADLDREISTFADEQHLFKMMARH